MRCCTLYSRRDGLHGINALMVISECDIRRNKEAWGETPEKDQGAISQNTSEMLRGSTNSWLGRHHGDGLAHLPARDRFGLYRLRASSRLSGGRDFIILC